MTNKIPAIASLLFVLFFSSCLDTEEKIVINKNNSGVYTVTLDMSKMLALMDQIGQENKDETKIPEKKDSTVYFKSFTDTSTTLTAKEKELFKEGSLRMQVDEAAKELIVTLNFPFKHINDLPELKSSYLAVIDKLGVSDKLKNEGDSGSDENIPSDLSKDKNILNPSQEAYAFAAAAGKISNTLINKELFNNKIQNDSSMQMLQQMTMMMGDMNYKTIIVAPAKIKKYKGNQTILSDDKKTVTFLTTLSDMLNRPEAAEYSVEY
ncbi:hypothetical protein [Agriterribacter sp.]|uniref:hypothetical protein n=1 Tax=Agriterribacter sp. TaxID=2821509 RepID=UPI002B64F414|nr:hypothetical protein [Agriterribacter sp.]HRO44512.1 hypothetical protein [Agriterribacter sp.]HRQ16462.1 hypothetical protein [Agriterribacter sp.]